MLRGTSVALALALSAAACTGPGATRSAPRPPTQAPEASPSISAAPAERLLYLQRRTLYAFELGTGKRRRVALLPSGDAALSPAGTELAVVEETAPGGHPEGFAAPVVSVVGVGGPGPARDLGPGRTPVWSPDGTAIAAVAPADGDEVVVAYRRDGAARRMLGPDRWALLGWSGPFVAAIGEGAGVVVGNGDEVEAIDLAPSEVWGISPIEPVIAVSRPATTSLYRAGDETRLELDGVLGDGAWSPDGTTIAAVILGDGRPYVALIDVAARAVEPVADSARAQGNVVWSEDSQSFAYVRVDPGDATRLQAVICTRAGVCIATFSWAEGVTLLGFAPTP